MELNSKIIEITNKADLSGILPQKLKDMYLNYFKANLFGMGGSSMSSRGYQFFRVNNTECSETTSFNSILPGTNVIVCLIFFLLGEERVATGRTQLYVVSTSGRVSKEALKRINLEGFPDKLLFGTPEYHALLSMERLSMDSRSKFYNISLQKLFEQM